MPHTLTDRQREYLEFIRDYIRENESSPRLEEIAGHFHVTKPTANKALSALQEKGYLYFGRDKVTGFYIRTPEIYTRDGTLREIMITGVLDRYGEVLQFPKNNGHFPFVLPDGTGDVFALEAYQHIPCARLIARDKIIFSTGGLAKPGDICVFPFGKRKFLVRMYEPNYSEDMPFYILAKEWIDVTDEIKDHLFWWPLAIDEENAHYFIDIVEEQQLSWSPVSPDMIIGKALRVVRRLAI